MPLQLRTKKSFSDFSHSKLQLAAGLYMPYYLSYLPIEVAMRAHEGVAFQEGLCPCERTALRRPEKEKSLFSLYLNNF